MCPVNTRLVRQFLLSELRLQPAAEDDATEAALEVGQVHGVPGAGGAPSHPNPTPWSYGSVNDIYESLLSVLCRVVDRRKGIW